MAAAEKKTISLSQARREIFPFVDMTISVPTFGGHAMSQIKRADRLLRPDVAAICRARGPGELRGRPHDFLLSQFIS